MLKLNVGLSKKIGLPDYGSRGAAVNLELELESSLLGDPDRLKERIRQLFAMVKSSVDEELAAQSPTGNEINGGNGKSAGNGHTNGHANCDRRDGTRRATASQIRALVAISERRKLDLEGLLADQFHTREAAELSIVEASQLIDELKQAGNGTGGRR